MSNVDANIKLYSFWKSSSAWRVRICLELKGCKYDVIPVNLYSNDGGEHRKPEYFEINPMGQVPTMVVGDKCFGQSMAMMEYIEEKYEGYNLLPKDLLLRAKVRELCETICSGIQPLQNVKALQRMKVNCDINEACKIVITNGFSSLEKMLKQSSGTYCVGNEITMADACLVPQVKNANRFQVDMSQFPIISQINDNLLKHPAIIKSHPNKQPGSPEM